MNIARSVSTQITGGLGQWLTPGHAGPLQTGNWSPRTMFKMKLDARDPAINRDKSNQEALEQGQKSFQFNHNH